MTATDVVKRNRETASILCAVLVIAGSALSQSPPVKVTLSSVRAVVYRHQPMKLRVTIENQGALPTPPLKRGEILGKKNFLCAVAAFSREENREGVWAQPVGPAATGTIGPLMPGESFITSVELVVPASLAESSTPLSVQWVGTLGKLEELRSTEVQVNLRDGKHPLAIVETSVGEFTLELWEDKAPNHVANFILLARKGFYDGLTFHRVFPNFVIQTGSPDGSVTGGPGYTIPFEANDGKFLKGVVGMAIIGEKKDTAGSQWFVCIADAPTLDGKYTGFGKVVDGQDKADGISRPRAGPGGKPIEPASIRSVKVFAPKTYEMPELKKTGDKSDKDGK